MAQNDPLTAARYNNLQTRIARIFGTGTGNTGYGQTVSSQQVPGGSVKLVEAVDMQELYDDMVACRVHQTGLIPSEIANIQPGDLITDDDGGTDTPGVLPLDGDKKGVVDYEGLMTVIEQDKFLINEAGQAEYNAVLTAGGTPITSTRNTSFNSQLTHEFSINFQHYNHARYFFNTGGEIRISADVPDGTGKQHDWYQMLDSMDIVKFGYTSTNASSGTNTGIGFYDLTTTSQVIFTKEGDPATVYAENDYTIKAWADAVTYLDPPTNSQVNESVVYKIYFRVEFNDDDAGEDPTYPIDESVNPPIASVVEFLRASGSYVDVPAPTGTNTSTL